MLAAVIPAGSCSLPGAAHPQPDLLSGIFRERLPWMKGWYWVIRYEASLIQRRLLKSLTWRVTQGPQPQGDCAYGGGGLGTAMTHWTHASKLVLFVPVTLLKSLKPFPQWRKKKIICPLGAASLRPRHPRIIKEKSYPITDAVLLPRVTSSRPARADCRLQRGRPLLRPALSGRGD